MPAFQHQHEVNKHLEIEIKENISQLANSGTTNCQLFLQLNSNISCLVNSVCNKENPHLQSGALEAYQSAAQQDKQKCPFEQLPHREGYQGEQN